MRNLCLAKFNEGYKLKDFSAMLGGRKGKSYVIPVWSDKTVLEMLFWKYFVYIARVHGVPVETFN